MGPKPVDPLIDNFGHFVNCGKVKFGPVALQNGVDMLISNTDTI